MVNIGLDKQKPASSLLKLMYNELREGMTIIAETKDNCIVGAAVNAGSCPWDPDKFVEFARCCEYGPIRDVIEFEAYVTCKPNLWERYCVLKIFECSYLAVRPDFRNQGIARKLVLDSWYLARDCGYRLFRVDCNNRWVQLTVEFWLGYRRVRNASRFDAARLGRILSNFHDGSRQRERSLDSIHSISHVQRNIQCNCYLVILTEELKTADVWLRVVLKE